MKVAPYTTQKVFVGPFSEDLESWFLEDDAVSAEFATEDKNTLKHKSNLIKDTEWSILVVQGSETEIPGSVEV